MRRLWMILAALLIIGVGPLASGQDYPSRPIRFITPAQPGGTTLRNRTTDVLPIAWRTSVARPSLMRATPVSLQARCACRSSRP